MFHRTLIAIFLVTNSLFTFTNCKNKPNSPPDLKKLNKIDTALGDPEKFLARKAPPTFTVKFKTTSGNFRASFTRDSAPESVDRFFLLAKSGYFDGTTLFRRKKECVYEFGVPKVKKYQEHWGHFEKEVVEEEEDKYVEAKMQEALNELEGTLTPSATARGSMRTILEDKFQFNDPVTDASPSEEAIRSKEIAIVADFSTALADTFLLTCDDENTLDKGEHIPIGRVSGKIPELPPLPRSPQYKDSSLQSLLTTEKGRQKAYDNFEGLEFIGTVKILDHDRTD